MNTEIKVVRWLTGLMTIFVLYGVLHGNLEVGYLWFPLLGILLLVAFQRHEVRQANRERFSSRESEK